MSVTRYASLKPSAALLILSATVIATGVCLAVAPHSPMTPQSAPKHERSDVDIYRRVVQRVHNGQNYYDALGSELRGNARPTKSVANWRTPLHLGLLAAVPSPSWMRIPGLALAATAVVLSLVMIGAATPALAITQGLLMAGALLACFGEPGLFLVEAWAGLMIVLSIEAYAFQRRKPAIIAGLLALFLRELALPYVLVCVVLAIREKRWKELLAWLVGLGGYAACFGVHVAMVSSRILPTDLGNTVSWIQFAGLPFLIRASAMWALVALPSWVTAVYLPAALLGLGGWKNSVTARAAATVLVYLGIFSVVGHPANSYWGAMYSGVLAFGAAWAIPSLRDLLRALVRAVPVSAERPSRSIGRLNVNSNLPL